MTNNTNAARIESALVEKLEGIIARAAAPAGVKYSVHRYQGEVAIEAVYSEEHGYIDEPFGALVGLPEFDRSTMTNDNHGKVVQTLEWDVETFEQRVERLAAEARARIESEDEADGLAYLRTGILEEFVEMIEELDEEDELDLDKVGFGINRDNHDSKFEYEVFFGGGDPSSSTIAGNWNAEEFLAWVASEDMTWWECEWDQDHVDASYQKEIDREAASAAHWAQHGEYA